MLVLGLALRVALIHCYPIIFGGDSVTRLVYHDRILIAYQLPALQASIWAISKISPDPLLIRYWMAVVGAAAGVGFYYLAQDLVGRRWAMPAALLFVSNPFVLAQSTVPYQEILMLGALCFAFHFFFAERWLAASLSLGLACLTRYEAWAACPVLAVAYVWGRGVGTGWKATGWKAGVTFGWAPLVWMACNAGLSPAGTYVLEAPLTLGRLHRWAYLGWITVKFTPAPVLALAVVGLWRVWKQGLLASPRLRVLAVFVALFLAAVLFSAHGERQDPERWVTAREAHLPIWAVTLLAGRGLPRWPRLAPYAAAAGMIWGVSGAARYMARETSEPRVVLSYSLAQYLDRTVPAGERALVLSPSIPAERVQAFLERTGARGRGVLERFAAAPPDFGRTLVHARASRPRLVGLVNPAMSASARAAQLAAGVPEWIVVWSDFRAGDPDETKFEAEARASGPPVEVLRAGPLSAEVYRTR